MLDIERLKIYKDSTLTQREIISEFLNKFSKLFPNDSIELNNNFISFNFANDNNIELTYKRCWIMKMNNNLIISYKKDVKSKTKSLSINTISDNKLNTIEEYYYPKKVKIPFYEKLTDKEKSILDDFKSLINEILPGYILKDKNPNLYGFYPDNYDFEDGIIKNICWISKPKGKKYLCLKYRKKVDSSETTIELKNKKIIEDAWHTLRVTYTKRNSEIDEYVRKIKNKEVLEYNTSNLLNTTLMEHQKVGAILANKYDKFAFFYDTGTGKTIMALEIMMNKFNLDGSKFLVIAPKSLIKSAWLDDSKKFKNMKLLPLSFNMSVKDYCNIFDEWEISDGRKRIYTNNNGELKHKVTIKQKDDIVEKLKMRAHHFIVNIDRLYDNDRFDEIFKNIKLNGLIIDESVIIKNYRSKSAIAARRYSKNMKYVYLLSGLPAPNTTIEYYSQMKIIDPKTFSISYDKFIEKYYKKVGISKYVYKNNFCRDEVVKMVTNRSITVKKEECIDLPEISFTNYSVEMDNDIRSFYNKVFSNMFAEILDKDGNLINFEQSSRFAIMTKLREIATGIYIDEKQEDYFINDNKIQVLLNLIDEIGYKEDGTRKQLIIWCNFKNEIRIIEEQLNDHGISTATAYSETKDIDTSIYDFKNGKCDVLIANIASLKFGVTFTNCQYAIFDSLNYSYSDYCQARDRIYRKGAEHPCFIYHLITENSIDEDIYSCIMHKGKNVNIFEKLIKKARKNLENKNQIYNLIIEKGGVK